MLNNPKKRLREVLKSYIVEKIPFVDSELETQYVLRFKRFSDTVLRRFLCNFMVYC
ncbi:hypothetical protein GCM10022260_25870 [Gaetbulibacter aestuarii]